VTPKILVLVLLSAFLHPWWNYFAKRSPHPLAFLTLMNATITIVLLPAFIVLLWLKPISAAGWLWLGCSCVFHSCYNLCLSQSYHKGDMTVVYPIARSSPLFVAVMAVAFLGEEIAPLAWVGIILTVAGIAGSGLEKPDNPDGARPARRFVSAGVVFAVLTALALAGLSLTDKQARHEMLSVQLFAGFSLVSSTALLVGVLAGRAWGNLKKEWSAGKTNWLLAAAFNFGSYILILMAYGLPGAKVSYIVAARQVSIVIAVFCGVAFLKERYNAVRFACGLLILLGVLLISVSK